MLKMYRQDYFRNNYGICKFKHRKRACGLANLSIKSCEYCFKHFGRRDFDIRISGQPNAFEDL